MAAPCIEPVVQGLCRERERSESALGRAASAHVVEHTSSHTPRAHLSNRNPRNLALYALKAEREAYV